MKVDEYGNGTISIRGCLWYQDGRLNGMAVDLLVLDVCDIELVKLA